MCQRKKEEAQRESLPPKQHKRRKKKKKTPFPLAVLLLYTFPSNLSPPHPPPPLPPPPLPPPPQEGHPMHCSAEMSMGNMFLTGAPCWARFGGTSLDFWMRARCSKEQKHGFTTTCTFPPCYPPLVQWVPSPRDSTLTLLPPPPPPP
eukprot:Sspe_Gene.101043::Locus_75665_Transcript_1_1_Confidence_1.000_Length_616::g.101043::m.101043